VLTSSKFSMKVLHNGILLQIKYTIIYNKDHSLLDGVRSGAVGSGNVPPAGKVTGSIHWGHWDFSLMYVIFLTALWP